MSEEKKLEHLNAVNIELSHQLEANIKNEICEKLGITGTNPSLSPEAQNILLSICYAVQRWVTPYDKNDMYALVSDHSRGIAYGANIEDDAQRKIFFDVMMKFTKAICNRKRLLGSRIDLAEQLYILSLLEYLDTPEGYIPTGKVPTPEGDWTTGSEFKKMKDAMGIDHLLHPKKRGKSSD